MFFIRLLLLPPENVMDVNDLVDAALAGLEAGELVTAAAAGHR
jgi:hypothetical protein